MRAAIEMHGAQILPCLKLLQQKAEEQDGLDYLHWPKDNYWLRLAKKLRVPYIRTGAES